MTFRNVWVSTEPGAAWVMITLQRKGIRNGQERAGARIIRIVRIGGLVVSNATVLNCRGGFPSAVVCHRPLLLSRRHVGGSVSHHGGLLGKVMSTGTVIACHFHK